MYSCLLSAAGRGDTSSPRPVRACADPAGPTILIVTAPTGAGHNSTATALAEALAEVLPRARVLVLNPLDGGAMDPLQISRWYDLAAAHAPRLWGWLYRLSNNRGGVWLSSGIMGALRGRRLRAAIRATRPNLVVSVHPLCVRLAAHALRRERHKAMHHCVVTDLVSIHRYWASANVAVFYVATSRAAAALMRYGISAERIRMTGLPLRHSFTVPAMSSGAGPIPHVVILDGGRATPTLERAVRALLASDKPLRLTVVCGGNDRLRRRLTRIANNRAMVLGWSDDVAGLMRSASVVVTKAGSVTLAEAFSQARPVLVYHVLPGQEEGNIALLEREGWGRHVPDVDALPAAVTHIRARYGVDGQMAAWWGQATNRVAAHVAGAAVEGQHASTVSPVPALQDVRDAPSRPGCSPRPGATPLVTGYRPRQ